MSLPWVRLDSNLATHDKILALLDDKPATLVYRAAFSYTCSLGYCGGHGTDGLVPFSAVPFIHGNKQTAELLVKHELWAPDPLGWRLPKWDVRQQSDAVTNATRNAQRRGALKANCTRWHGKDCKCWESAA